MAVLSDSCIKSGIGRKNKIRAVVFANVHGTFVAKPPGYRCSHKHHQESNMKQSDGKATSVQQFVCKQITYQI